MRILPQKALAGSLKGRQDVRRLTAIIRCLATRRYVLPSGS